MDGENPVLSLFLQCKAEARTFILLAVDGDMAAMQQHGILDDGETEAGAAHVAAAAFVDAVETLEDAEALLTNWEVGLYISRQLKSARWGAKVVSELADYLKRQNPKRRGYSKRNLYNMVKFYELYSTPKFAKLTSSLELTEIVQLPTAQLESSEFEPIPSFLTVTPFTNHVEIINRCKSYEKRVFYMLYAAHQRLKNYARPSYIILISRISPLPR